MNRHLHRVLVLLLIILSPVYSLAQMNSLDSLEEYAKIAKPGWDQIDVAIGLGRQYIGATNELEKGREQIELIYKYAETYNLPSAKSYALVLQNLIAYQYDYDADAAIRFCEEAIEIANQTGNKDALIYASYQLAENYTYEKGNPEKGKEVLLGVVDQMDETVSLKNQGGVHKNLGYVYGLLGDYEKGLFHFNESLRLFQEIVDNPPIDPRINRVSAQLNSPISHVCFTHNFIGDLYKKKGESDKAIYHKEQALEAAIKSKVDVDIGWMYNNLSLLHSEIGNYKLALECIQNARLLFEEIGLETELARANSTMILLYIDLDDLESAEELLLDNLTYYKKIDHQLFYANSLLQLLKIYIKQNRIDDSKKFLTEAERIIDEMDNKANDAQLAQVKGQIFLKGGDYNSALQEFRKAIQIDINLENEVRLASNEYLLSSAFNFLQQYDSALFHVKIALEKSKNTKDLKFTKDSYLLLSQIHQALANYSKSLESYQLYHAYSDSLYTLGAQAKLKEEQVRQDVVSFQNEKELAEQNAALLARQNKIYVIVGSIIFLILILVAYLYSNLRKVKAKIESQNLQLSNLNQTKDKFFGIIAHDLRSPLIGLQGVGDQVDYFLKKGKTDRLEQVSKSISDTTKRLNELLDNLLNWALLQNGMIPYHPQKVNIKAQVDSIMDLLKPLAEMKNVNLKNEIEDDTFVYADEKAVNTILRNLVSNSLKFTEQGGKISVNVESESESISITINDTGTGISAEQLPRIFELEKVSTQGTMGEKGTGLGLVLCKELVELNQGKIAAKSTLGEGSSFTFHLPKAA